MSRPPLPVLLCLLPLAFFSCLISTLAATPDYVDVFSSGDGLYHTYRIPAFLVTEQGTLLAFAEGRVTSSDHAQNDMVMRRSTDGGDSWGPVVTLHDDGGNSLNDPLVVQVREGPHAGRIYLQYMMFPEGCHTGCVQPGHDEDSSQNFRMYSDDDGVTWTAPANVTLYVRPIESSFAGTPGQGIQKRRAPYAGRLIYPMRHSLSSQIYMLFSDDGGDTWNQGAIVDDSQTPGVGNEVQIVELADGRVMLNARSHSGGTKHRKIAYSTNGGDIWSPLQDSTLIEPQVDCGIHRYTDPLDGKLSRIIFSGPFSQTSRVNGHVHLSYDEGATWPIHKQIYSGAFAYSKVGTLPDGRIGCLFEKDSYARITLARLTLDWLTDGADQLEPDGPVIQIDEVSDLTTTSAVLNATLLVNHATSTTVRAYWGPSNGGDVTTNWSFSATVGSHAGAVPVSFAHPVQDLAPNTTYWARFQATNVKGTNWSDAATFTSLPDFSRYAHQMDITFSGYDRAEALQGFPALITLGTNRAGFSYADSRLPEGGDLRFSDAGGTAAIPHEVEAWDTNGVSTVWVRLPALTQAATILAHWGDHDATASTGIAEQVWSSGFEGVYHLHDDAGDATSNGRDGTVEGGVSSGPLAGQIARGWNFDGIDDSIEAARGIQDDFTIAFWMRAESSGNVGTDWWNGQGLVNCELPPPVVRDFGVTYLEGKTVFGTGNPDATLHPSVTVDDGGWHHVAVTRVRSTGQKIVYVDGSPRGTGTGVTDSLAEAASLSFGDIHSGSAGRNYDGLLDEVRLSGVARSPDWIWACWMNQGGVDALASYSPAVFRPDVDGDGMTDAWEGANFGHIDHADAYTDWDLDGFLDTHEFWAGTSPTDSDSLLNMVDETIVDGDQVLIQWSSVSGKVYNLERSTNVLVRWDLVAPDLPATPPTNVHTDLVDSAETVLYRIRLGAP